MFSFKLPWKNFSGAAISEQEINSILFYLKKIKENIIDINFDTYELDEEIERFESISKNINSLQENTESIIDSTKNKENDYFSINEYIIKKLSPFILNKTTKCHYVVIQKDTLMSIQGSIERIIKESNDNSVVKSDDVENLINKIEYWIQRI